MAEEIARTTDVEPQPGWAFQRYFDSIQVACDPAPPLWPTLETPEAAELREAEGRPPPPPFKHAPYDHSRKLAAAPGGQSASANTPGREKAEATRREVPTGSAETHKAGTTRR